MGREQGGADCRRLGPCLMLRGAATAAHAPSAGEDKQHEIGVAKGGDGGCGSPTATIE